jgi:hypothetical protein
MRAEVKAELEEIAKNSETGELDPKEVVAFARSTNTALHAEFEWDDTKAGEQYRFHQARNLILRIKVQIVGDSERKESISIREFASVHSDDGKREYRSITDVLEDADQRAELVETILRACLSRCLSYPLPELEPVIRAINKVLSKIERTKEAA